MTARRHPETYENNEPQITQITQIFFLRAPSNVKIFACHSILLKLCLAFFQ
jgi:hypothetical protein